THLPFQADIFATWCQSSFYYGANIPLWLGEQIGELDRPLLQLEVNVRLVDLEMRNDLNEQCSRLFISPYLSSVSETRETDPFEPRHDPIHRAAESRGQLREGSNRVALGLKAGQRRGQDRLEEREHVRFVDLNEGDETTYSVRLVVDRHEQQIAKLANRPEGHLGRVPFQGGY
ncbi:hypothetical protein PRIPAC_85348, partial [Pristionchus pacificus]|uniref:Uncharacterized protein n=1 Tax=Pristionchus pacificus TaxID=54126 RepID=A0A2A6CEF8_PRIPA